MTPSIAAQWSGAGPTLVGTIGFKVAGDDRLATLQTEAAARGDPIVLKVGHFLEYFALSPEREAFDAKRPRN